MKTPPVLFIVFSRPDTTARVFEAIRKAKPSRLYVAADGYRADKRGEKERCEQVRAICTHIDWDCELRTFFRDENHGCGEQVTQAINWFFEQEEEGIILEDDCLPSDSFFGYCAEMLSRYRNDTRIMMIAGNNLERVEDREKEYSYTFSTLTYIWGWATWRRAWKLHDFNMPLFGEVDAKHYLEPTYSSIYERDLFQYVFGKMYAGDDHKTSRRNIWDYQWQFAAKIHSGLTAVPSVNLVANIGFGAEATSTGNADAPGQGLRCEEITLPLKHPGFVMAEHNREARTFMLCHTSPKSRLKSNIRSFLPTRVISAVRALLF